MARIVSIMSYFKSERLKPGYRKRMLEMLKEIGTFDLKEQQLADSVRSIRKNSLVSEVDMEELKRKIAGDMREGINVQEAIHEEEYANDFNEIPDIAVNDPVESENETRHKAKEHYERKSKTRDAMSPTY